MTHERLRAAFDALVALPASERAAHARSICGNDVELEQRVLQLLAIADDLGTAMDRTPAAPAAATGDLVEGADAVIDECIAIGGRIGRYTLLERLGEGGFGIVYRAEETEPVRRDVAIKILKFGMDSPSLVARFRLEMQALAWMESPHIASVLEAGVTASGRPYFVMDLVRGVPITRFCDEHALSVRRRIELFLHVCTAVQHAHQKGVFHRDLKPSNVLVAERDGRPTATVIDFGIAKATELTHADDAATHDAATQLGQPLGTRGYMSPEQVQGSLDIDARTDVFSLGVLLYELLTGATPLEWAGLRQAPFADVVTFVCQTDVPKPSTRLRAAESATSVASIASMRSTVPSRLVQALRGDLDWILTKALECERERRYVSASELAADLERHLRDEPVLAGPPSGTYRLRKFTRRHRAAAIGVAAVAIVTTLGLAGTLTGLVQARSAARIATTRQAEAEFIAEFQSAMLAGMNTQVSGRELVQDILTRHDEALAKAGVNETERSTRAEALRRELAAVNATDVAALMIDRAIVAPAVRTLDEGLDIEPVIDARLRATLAASYAQLGRTAESIALYRAALATRRAQLGDDDPRTLELLDRLGVALRDAGDAAGAEAALAEALATRRRTLGDTHVDTLRSLSGLAAVYVLARRSDDAERAARAAVDGLHAEVGDAHPATIDAMRWAGEAALLQGKYADAEASFLRALELARSADAARGGVPSGPNGGLLLVLEGSMSSLLLRQGRYADAEPHMQAALAGFRRALGDEHPTTLKYIANLGAVLAFVDKLEESEALSREAFERNRATKGADHPETIAAQSNLARVIQVRHRLDEALPIHQDAFERGRRVWGADDPRVIGLQGNVGAALLVLGRARDAEPMVRDAHERRARIVPPDHPEFMLSLVVMGTLYEALDDLDRAEPLLREACARRTAVLTAAHPDTIFAMEAHGRVLRKRGALAEAEPLLRAVVDARKTSLGAGHRDTLSATRELALVARGVRSSAEAAALLRPALEAALATPPDAELVPIVVDSLQAMIEFAPDDVEAPRWREALDRFRQAAPG